MRGGWEESKRGTQMKILEWNVNCKIGYGRKKLMPLIEHLKLGEHPEYDILILTEFYRLSDFDEFKKTIEASGYETSITNERKGYNDVFIAVLKKYCIEESNIQNDNLDKQIGEGLPDFLSVPIQVENFKLTVIGVRFRGGCSDMKEQFIRFLPLINKYENIIIGGDFNNAKIYGDENTVYSERQTDSVYSYWDNDKISKYAHFEYNYHRIKYWFALNKFSLITPSEKCSFPRYRTKIDHFAVKGIRMENVEYLETKASDHNQLVGEVFMADF